MKFSASNLTITLSLLIAIALIPACGRSSRPGIIGQGTATGPKGPNPSSPSPSTGCGAQHRMGSYVPVFTYSYCDKIDTVHIDRDTVGAGGEPLGSKSMDRGMLSFQLTNMTNGKITDRETFGVFFNADGNSNREVNWQWMSYAVGGGAIQSRLIIQRFDGSCPGFCENAYITDDLQFESSTEVFNFSCGWDTQIGSVWCEITKEGDPSFNLRADNDTMGPYNTLRYIGVGRNAFEGPYPGYDGTVSKVVLTVFN